MDAKKLVPQKRNAIAKPPEKTDEYVDPEDLEVMS